MIIKKGIETFGNYDKAIGRLMDEGYDSKEALEIIDKVTNFKKLNREIENITNIREIQKILTIEKYRWGNDMMKQTEEKLRRVKK